MKKFYIIFIIIIAIFSFSGCNNTEQYEEINDDKLTIVTTIFPPYDFAREVAGDQVYAKMLLNPGEESHSYEPTPSDIKSIQNADLFIYIGGENDVWVDQILESMGEDRPDTLKLLDVVSTLTEEIVEGMEDDHEHEHHEDEHSHDYSIDEHIWTSPKNAILIVEKITEILCEKDLENAEIYKENSQAYIIKLKQLDTDFREVVSNSVRNTIIFGDRFPFRYLAEEYQIEYYAAFSGCSTETEASPKTIAFLIDKVKEEEVPVVFTIEFSNGKIADSITEATNTEKMLLHSCHNLTKEQLEKGETYLSLMQQNVEALWEALN